MAARIALQPHYIRQVGHDLFVQFTAEPQCPSPFFARPYDPPLYVRMLSRTKIGLSLSPLACPTSWPLAHNFACRVWPSAGDRQLSDDSARRHLDHGCGVGSQTGLEWAIIQFRDLDRRENRYLRLDYNEPLRQSANIESPLGAPHGIVTLKILTRTVPVYVEWT